MKNLKITIAFLFIFGLLFQSCEDEEVDPRAVSLYNGEYYGNILTENRTVMGEWYMKIENGSLSSNFDGSDVYTPIEGSVDKNGIITAVATFDDTELRLKEQIIITLKGVISLEDNTMTGSWINHKEDIGHFEGVKR
ncbi:hypothetical protein EI427_22360 [Flammeovirga pectinis]|uniref:Lipocalin-like domain-containing protein n=1 Tax=Flammeovirga pectinis TaxID=2494373 RepID=A0A3S9P9T1_9BACT|nr:hypothetical protein [Flammeovirga pectinis]AZQ64968.1 hypothetical protein EI427_22360 [Flammeovirga pectinis]